MFIWSSDRTGAVTLPEIAKTGSNAVRLVWTTNGNVNEFDQLISNSIANNMVPVAELHDATGDFSKLQLLLDYWKQPEVLNVIQEHKKWLIVNIGNEIGNGSESVQQWVNYYKDAITQLRNAGIDTPLMIDSGGWGNQERYVVEGGLELLNHDPLGNIIFSVHTYWTNGTDSDKIQRLDNLITNMAQQNLSFIIGEGPQLAASPIACNELFPYDDMIQRLEEEKIGWLSWSWGLVNNSDCGAPNSVFDVTTNGIYGNWATTFGEEISVSNINSIQNTSIIPQSLLTGVCNNTQVQYTLSTNSSPINGGSISLSPAGGTYNEGTIVTVTAIPSSGYNFDNWSGNSSSNSSSIQITMNGNNSITANFSEQSTGGINSYTVRARGTIGSEQISLVVNNNTIETWTLTTNYQDYTLSSNALGSTRIEFINDQGSRDVRVDYIIVNAETLQSEDQQTNTGVWQGQCGGSYSEWIHCFGYIDYGTITNGDTTNVDVTGINLTPTALNMNEGETATISAMVSPDNATNTNVNWSSNNTNVATVNNSGIVTAVNEGLATITATTEDGGFTANTSVTVNATNGGGNSLCENAIVVSLQFMV